MKAITLLVGLIADTHDNLPMVDKAVKRLNEENVELVLHAGDYVAPFVIPRFKELKAKMVGVFGNNDGDRELLKRKFQDNERLEMRGSFAKLTADSLKVVLTHGSEEEIVKTLIESQGFDIVVYGHTHVAQVYRRGKTLVINPGEVCGYLSGKSTIAFLDTGEAEATIVEL